MANRLEIFTKVNDTKSQMMLQKLRNLEFPITEATVAEVYTLNKHFKQQELEKISKMLSNPISQNYLIDDHNKELQFDFALEIGFLPGVTDNVASIAKESIEELLKINFEDEESVHSSDLIFLKGNGLNEAIVQEIGESIANSLIQRIHIKDHQKFASESGMDVIVPKVKLKSHPQADEVDLNVSDEELLELGKKGIKNEDGSHRGPLALDKLYLGAIKKYFDEVEKRKPRDIELESIAQTWSEHCKHTIFASQMDEVKDGIYKHYIKRATHEIRKEKGDKDFCVSVFSDNSGGIVFDDDWIVSDKAETHNSPSALDPYGGSITGIVGVNRDTIGFGMGAKPIINKYGFCVGYPDDDEPLYKDDKKEHKMLSPKRILDGIVEGVKDGGNESGIPTPQGFLCFNDRYKGKPLVFVGTVGLIPKEVNGKAGWEKKAQAGDLVVVIGGRVGQDGIHGATFSSEALTSGSPATAVQIGDAFTQKKLSDAIVKEARDKGLYSSITDNGAGGISCSVAEMAKECGGCYVELEKVPLKYPNLEPWKIWISESQERMTLSVPQEKLDEFMEVMKKHGVESTVIGEFNDSGRCKVDFNGETIMDVDMDFLHDGLPDKTLNTTYTKEPHPEPDFNKPSDLSETLHEMLARPNLCSFEFISTQYDHNVLGGSVLKPLQGKGRVNGSTSASKPILSSDKAVMCSHGINPVYSDIDTYHMAACAIDTAVRNIIAAGAHLDYVALMDNFCWCSSTEEERLGQLKEAARACYEYATVYGTPFISGKDSMFNDFKGFNQNGESLKISIPPTLLVSSISVIDDATKTVSLDTKIPGDLVYIIGDTKNELGASEYFLHMDKKGKIIGNNVPQVDHGIAKKIYEKMAEATDKRLIASAFSPNIGGLGITLAKKAIAGQLGMEIDLTKIPGADNFEREDYLLFSESQSRIVVTVDPNKKDEFENLMNGLKIAQIGVVTEDQNFIIKGFNGDDIIKTNVPNLDDYYRKTFKQF
ncbi:AIR synthase-related protein [Patescibacteria group bacterium]